MKTLNKVKITSTTSEVIYDAIVVGAGPSGLMVSIELRNLHANLSVIVLEKASVIGGHSISGAILERNEQTEEFIEDLKLATAIKGDQIWHLSQEQHTNLSWLMPASLKNGGSVLIDLPELCIKMTEKAKALGVEVFECCEVVNVIREGNCVIGVELIDGSKLFGRHVFLAEGANGTVTSKLLSFHNVFKNKSFALGMKEEWELKTNYPCGNVYHTFGWPSISRNSFGGGFIYFYNNIVSIGYVTHLDYKNPYVCPSDEFNLFKNHPSVRKILDGNIGKRLKYGAKVITLSSVGASHNACYPGCTIIGCAFGLVNTLKLKGLSMALESGREAALNYVSTFFKPSGNVLDPWLSRTSEVRLAWSRKTTAIMKSCGIVVAIVMRFALKPFIRTWFAKIDDRNTTLRASLIQPPRTWHLFDGRSTALADSGNTYVNRRAHISIEDKLRHKLHDLRMQDKLTSRLCPGKVYIWMKINKHYQPFVRHGNCIQCKACCIKPKGSAISWKLSINGSGPNYTAGSIASYR
ncbi:MAG: 4Fe-4S dicluster domain-containing protein [Candidatus Hodgkinia cicadicola]